MNLFQVEFIEVWSEQLLPVIPSRWLKVSCSSGTNVEKAPPGRCGSSLLQWRTAAGTASCWRSTPPFWDWPWTSIVPPPSPWRSRAGCCVPMVPCSSAPRRHLHSSDGTSSAAWRTCSSTESQSQRGMRRSGRGQGADGCLGCTGAAARREAAVSRPAWMEGSAKRTLVEVSGECGLHHHLWSVDSSLLTVFTDWDVRDTAIKRIQLERIFLVQSSLKESFGYKNLNSQWNGRQVYRQNKTRLRSKTQALVIPNLF